MAQLRIVNTGSSNFTKILPILLDHFNTFHSNIFPSSSIFMKIAQPSDKCGHLTTQQPRNHPIHIRKRQAQSATSHTSTGVAMETTQQLCQCARHAYSTSSIGCIYYTQAAAPPTLINSAHTEIIGRARTPFGKDLCCSANFITINCPSNRRCRWLPAPFIPRASCRIMIY
jgi:hypothetical protein